MRCVALALVVLVACGGGGGGDDDAGGELDRLTCEQLRQRYADVLATLDRSCDVSSDCTSVNGVDTCNCVPHLSSDCGGDPVQRAAWEAAGDQLDPIAAEWDERCDSSCDDGQCTCDCAPRTTSCGPSGLCISDPEDSCFGVDAGP